MFDDMRQRDTVSWNTMIAGHVNYGNFEAAWEILREMKRCGFDFDGYTFGSILKGVACAYRCDLGEQVHSMVVKTGYAGNVYSGSALLDMYAKCGRVEEAYVVIDSLPERGVKLDDGAIAPILTLLDDAEFYKSTMQIHCKILKHGLDCKSTVCNATITSYSECGSIEDAERVFDGAFGSRDLVTWNSMLAAYLIHKKELLACKLFIDMQMLGFEPDIYSYTSIISAYSEEVHKNHGKSYHGLVIKRGLEKSEPISNALIARYLKSNSNSMEEALQIFKSMESKDRVSWNSILTGLSQMGLNEYALKFFGHMRYAEVEIDHYAFSAVLRACGNIELASQIAGYLLELEPEEHCTYVLLSDMYGHLKRWDEKASVKRLMRERGVRKVPGWSWIEIRNEVFSFKAEDRSHSRCEEIYCVLGVLMEEIKRMDFDANVKALMHDLDPMDWYCDNALLQNYDSVSLAA
ncbi:putative pentatricopeptide repeat-containing protein [Prunus yedoensis var. nudiflora]|uniref:Putative pentatricopeptide repeat-containing protein n=1 Tax=Prunus yedoensis var. nudiflora TaxID=2094558 RepID=A0A314ZG00_PRUYE|nr:putative pentatricopeptide repeat-containing protein [Prunus yedoensis var. nudiflora]